MTPKPTYTSARVGAKLLAPGEPSRGKVQRVFAERGFGFIRCLEGPADDIGQDFFFHYSGLAGCEMTDLQEGEWVQFEATYVPKGKRAEHIQREAE